jgi:DNA-binding CsgD family transcriptional regulator
MMDDADRPTPPPPVPAAGHDVIARFAAANHLSQRETALLSLLTVGLGRKDAASRLGCSLGTIDTYRRRIFRKTGSSSQAELFGALLGVAFRALDEALAAREVVRPGPPKVPVRQKEGMRGSEPTPTSTAVPPRHRSTRQAPRSPSQGNVRRRSRRRRPSRHDRRLRGKSPEARRRPDAWPHVKDAARRRRGRSVNGP